MEVYLKFLYRKGIPKADDLKIFKLPKINDKNIFALKLAFFIRFQIENKEDIKSDLFKIEFLNNKKKLFEAKAPLKILETSRNINFALVFENFIVPPETDKIDFNLSILKSNKVISEFKPQSLRVFFVEPSKPIKEKA